MAVLSKLYHGSDTLMDFVGVEMNSQVVKVLYRLAFRSICPVLTSPEAPSA
jgi:hypothetical protein